MKKPRRFFSGQEAFRYYKVPGYAVEKESTEIEDAVKKLVSEAMKNIDSSSIKSTDSSTQRVTEAQNL